MRSGAVMISNFLQLFTKSTLNQRETVQMYVTNINYGFTCGCIVEIAIILEGNEKEMRNTFKVFNTGLNTMVQCICSLFQV